MSDFPVEQPVWRRPPSDDEDMEHQIEHLRRQHLLLDPRNPWDIDTDVLDPMYHTSRLFWLLLVVLGGFVLTWGV